jgi:hypothetical protein
MARGLGGLHTSARVTLPQMHADLSSSPFTCFSADTSCSRSAIGIGPEQLGMVRHSSLVFTRNIQDIAVYA